MSPSNNQLTVTGLDGASSIPVGATITKAYYQVPGHYGTGATFATEHEALEHAITDLRAKVLDYAERHPGADPFPERVTIDLRWYLAFPDGGGTDMVARRITHGSLTSAEEHLDRIRRFQLAPQFGA